MDNAKHTTAIGCDDFKKWGRDMVKHFQFHYDADATVTDDLIKINYKDKLDISGNPKAILICNNRNDGTNLWSINFDDSLIDLEPSDILSFQDCEKEAENANK